jgi:hypothetical protein
MVIVALLQTRSVIADAVISVAVMPSRRIAASCHDTLVLTAVIGLLLAGMALLF